MKKTIILLLATSTLLLDISCNSHSDNKADNSSSKKTDQASSNFTKLFKGTINNKYPIEMTFIKTGNSISGNYDYPGKSISLKIVGTIDNAGNFTFDEFNNKNQKTGTFQGQLTGNNAIGQWTNPNGTKNFPFNITSTSEVSNSVAQVNNTSSQENTETNTEKEVLPTPPQIKFSVTPSQKKTLLDKLFEKNTNEKKAEKDLVRACNYTNATVRNYSVKLAGQDGGNFNLGQICDVFDGYYKNWKYVNDPASLNYVEFASNSINNGFNGDCDDFAVLMCASILSIGGEARISYAYGPDGGHAFTEVNIGTTDGSQIREYLQKRYKISGEIYGRKDGITQNFWLNMDWQASYPGGNYFNYTKGTTFYILQNTYENFTN